MNIWIPIFISASGLIVSIIILIRSNHRVNIFERNCIATLQNKVTALESNKNKQWEKFDGLAEDFHNLELRFARVEQKIEDKLNGKRE